MVQGNDMKQTELATILGTTRANIHERVNSNSDTSRVAFKALLIMNADDVRQAVEMVKKQEGK